MKKFYLFLLTLILCGSATMGFTQVTFSTEDYFVQPGDSVEVDIIVNNFTSIGSAQFAILWDADVLSYKNIKNFGIENLTNEMVDNPNFGFTEIDQGKVRFSWFATSSGSTDLPNDSAIFTIVFNVVGQIGDESEVGIGPCPGPPPFPVELSDEDSNVIEDIVINNGTIFIGTSNINDVLVQQFNLNAQPNPFRTHTNISFDLDQSMNTTLRIFDMAGKLIFENKIQSTGGEHTQVVKREMFPAAGTYFYQLETAEGIATRKLILIE